MDQQQIEVTKTDTKINVKVSGNRKSHSYTIAEIDTPELIEENTGEYLPNNKLVQRVKTDTKNVLIYTRDNNLYITRYADQYYKPHTWLIPVVTKKHIHMLGALFHEGGSEAVDALDTVVVGGKYETKIIRPLKILPILKYLALCSIDIEESVLNQASMHQTIRLVDSEGFSMPVRTSRFFAPKDNNPTVISRRLVNKEFLVAVRTTVKNSTLKVSKIVYNELYEPKNVMINRLAYGLSRIIPTFRHYNLFFEKECSRAEESGFFVFKKVMQDKDIRSTNLFILDSNNPDYSKIKDTYGKNIVRKHSFRHFLYAYRSSYLISSELSYHLFDPRVYLNTLRRAIAKKPLIFLQHGVMFAKPVENPAAAGFYKENLSINIHRSVISSELEATQFYKMGYKRSELIKSGLPKFDMPRISKRNKIVFMPTYRYWEEGLVNAGRIEETSFYDCIKNMLELFEKEGLLGELVITAHPKFSNYISDLFPNYKSNLEPDVTKAINSAKIFITDFSSASYDAHYGGAYPIYYWKERDYLEECYMAKSALTDKNCDGPAVYSDEELIKEVNRAINQEYKLDTKYKRRFKKIVEFDDNKNTQRLINYLKKNGIL